MKSRKGRVGRLDLLGMAERQQYRCALSGMTVTDENAELDHKVPVKDGGTSTIENLQWLHVEINRMKGAMSNEKFIQMCAMVVKHTHATHPPAGGLGPFASQ
jgi:5-methylcytosine-specific restriction endonuclease McrA